jgi:hypothetical protein
MNTRPSHADPWNKPIVDGSPALAGSTNPRQIPHPPGIPQKDMGTAYPPFFRFIMERMRLLSPDPFVRGLWGYHPNILVLL